MTLLLSDHETGRVSAVKVGNEWIPVLSESLVITETGEYNFEGSHKVIYKVAPAAVQAVRMRGT